jgi:hypothetical protein
MAEADLVLGLKAGRAAITAAVGAVSDPQLDELYR